MVFWGKLELLSESFWMLHNPNEGDKEVVVIPDDRIDILFHYISFYYKCCKT
ncbi:hypothetical protein D3C86_2172660 [compost metagenome]